MSVVQEFWQAPGPVWMGVEKRKISCTYRGSKRPSLYRRHSPTPFTLKAEVEALIAEARGCQIERYTHTHTFLFGVQESVTGTSGSSPDMDRRFRFKP